MRAVTGGLGELDGEDTVGGAEPESAADNAGRANHRCVATASNFWHAKDLLLS
jgi:hypothetical protein